MLRGLDRTRAHRQVSGKLIDLMCLFIRKLACFVVGLHRFVGDGGCSFFVLRLAGPASARYLLGFCIPDPSGRLQPKRERRIHWDTPQRGIAPQAYGAHYIGRIPKIFSPKSTGVFVWSSTTLPDSWEDRSLRTSNDAICLFCLVLAGDPADDDEIHATIRGPALSRVVAGDGAIL